MDDNTLDALVYPTWAFPPRMIGDLNTPHGNNARGCRHRRLPAITFPGLRSRHLAGRASVLGRAWSEPTLIKIVYGYEQAPSTAARLHTPPLPRVREASPGGSHLMAHFDDYATKYQTVRMERRDGILQMTFQPAAALQWGLLPHGVSPGLPGRGQRSGNKVVHHHRHRGYLFRSSRGGGTGMRSTPRSGSRLLGGQAPAHEPARYRGADDQRDQRPGLEALRDPALVRYRAGRR